MSDKVTVKMAEVKVAKAPLIVETLGVGSCVVVTLYDKRLKVGGLAHMMAAEMRKESKVTNTLRFVRPAIDELMAQMKKNGSSLAMVEAKVFGGASMFSVNSSQIGEKNILAAKQKLKDERIKIVAEDVGGNAGRSLWLDLETGKVVVARINERTVEL